MAAHSRHTQRLQRHPNRNGLFRKRCKRKVDAGKCVRYAGQRLLHLRAVQLQRCHQPAARVCNTVCAGEGFYRQVSSFGGNCKHWRTTAMKRRR